MKKYLNLIDMGYNLDKLKEIAEPRSKEAIIKAAERRKKRLKDKEISCSAALMEQISFISGEN